MVYLTKSQRGTRGLFLALPCRNCGCGIKARTLPFKIEADAQGKDTHYKKTTCADLKAEREAEQAGATAGADRTRLLAPSLVQALLEHCSRCNSPRGAAGTYGG